MSWAETKYAINSSVGTDDFEPLDKMMQNQMFPSEQVAFNWIERQEAGQPRSPITRTLTFGIDGKCKVRFETAGTSSPFRATVKVFKNDQEVYSVLDGSTFKTHLTNIIDFKKGDTIKIECETSVVNSSSYYIDDVAILGSILPKKTFEEVI